MVSACEGFPVAGYSLLQVCPHSKQHHSWPTWAALFFLQRGQGNPFLRLKSGANAVVLYVVSNHFNFAFNCPISNFRLSSFSSASALTFAIVNRSDFAYQPFWHTSVFSKANNSKSVSIRGSTTSPIHPRKQIAFGLLSCHVTHRVCALPPTHPPALLAGDDPVVTRAPYCFHDHNARCST